MEPTVLPVAASESSGDGATEKISWVARHNTVLTIAAASVAPVLYLLFLDRFATNSFFGDDWSVVLVVHPALHGHLSLSQLWGQYNESRLFLGNIVDVIFGLIDHFDLRSVIFFSAGVFIASFAVLLALFRRYIGKRLTPIPVLSIGIIWFSIADVQNSLWAFQVSWYLTVFFLVVMLFALLVPNSCRTLWFVVAVLASVAGTLSTVQGFLLWPLGAICILWSQPRARRVGYETAAWITTALVTMFVYLSGYNFSNNGCLPASSCSASVALHHPLNALSYFFALIGNVTPSGILFYFPVRSVTHFEVVGAALFISAMFILVQSWRFRASREPIPLPLLLIGFSLTFDATIALGRSGLTPSGAVNNNRYVMANLILLAGIVIYAWAHIPPLHVLTANGPWRVYASWLALVGLAIFLCVQAETSTHFGLTNGRVFRLSTRGSAQFFVNLDRLPPQDRACESYDFLLFQPGTFPGFTLKLRNAARDQLGEFQPASYRYYRKLGPGLPSLNCPRPPAPATSSAATSVLFPTKGAKLSGRITLDASAPNATGVKFWLVGGSYGYSGKMIGTATLTSHGWLASWNTKMVANGSYVILSEALNAAGSASSAGVSITVENTT